MISARTLRPAVVLATACLAVVGTGAACAADTGPAPDTAAATTPVDWPTYHGSGYRSGYAPSMPTATKIRLVKQLELDGKVYASPIAVGGRLIVATENNTVYAFNATTYAQLWKRHLGTPSPASERPCGNIDPLGITGTPAYDPVKSSVYVAPELSGNPPTHRLVSLNVATGAIRWQHSLDFAGVDSRVMQQRGALSVVGTRAWVPFGGLAGDCGNYKGRVIGLTRAAGTEPKVFTVPTTREAGIWTPPGITSDAAGHMLVAVGNGESGVGDRYDYSDSILRLDANAKRVDSFSPSTWATDNDADLDLGSQGPALVNQWVFSAGKSGQAYVLRRTHLGGIGGQVSSARICRSFGGTAVRGDTVYVPCTDGVRAVRIDSAGKMHVLWKASSSVTGSPVIGGGRIWSLDTGSGTLHALDPATGASRTQVSVGAVSRFATPALYGNHVYVPTLAGVASIAVT